MKMQRLGILGLVLSTLFSLAMPAFAAEPATGASHTALTRTSAAVPRGTSLGSAAEEQSYAAREAAAPQAKKFKGGDVIVISATAVAIVLLVVIILILI